MIRRVVGVSHVEDLDKIKDRAVRARCEAHAISLGKRLAMVSETFDDGLETADDVCALARELRAAHS